MQSEDPEVQYSGIVRDARSAALHVELELIASRPAERKRQTNQSPALQHYGANLMARFVQHSQQ
jgi:hypothetical protein